MLVERVDMADLNLNRCGWRSTGLDDDIHTCVATPLCLRLLSLGLLPLGLVCLLILVSLSLGQATWSWGRDGKGRPGMDDGAEDGVNDGSVGVPVAIACEEDMRGAIWTKVEDIVNWEAGMVHGRCLRVEVLA